MKLFSQQDTFDWRFFVIILIGNGLIVFGINYFASGVTTMATKAGVVQMILSGVIAGFTFPYTKLVARKTNWITAYGQGALLVASGAGLCGLIVHGYFATPNISATIAWIFFSNCIGSSLLIFSKRSHKQLPTSWQKMNDML